MQSLCRLFWLQVGFGQWDSGLNVLLNGFFYWPNHVEGRRPLNTLRLNLYACCLFQLFWNHFSRERSFCVDLAMPKIIGLANLPVTWAEDFSQNYVRPAATSVDKSKNSPQFSYKILPWMRWIWRQKFNAFNAKLCRKIAVNFPTCQP